MISNLVTDYILLNIYCYQNCFKFLPLHGPGINIFISWSVFSLHSGTTTYYGNTGCGILKWGVQSFPLTMMILRQRQLSNFVSPVWKLHNLYCHTLHTQLSGGLFGPNDKWKKLSDPILLPFLSNLGLKNLLAWPFYFTRLLDLRGRI